MHWGCSRPITSTLAGYLSSPNARPISPNMPITCSIRSKFSSQHRLPVSIWIIFPAPPANHHDFASIKILVWALSHYNPCNFTYQLVAEWRDFIICHSRTGLLTRRQNSVCSRALTSHAFDQDSSVTCWATSCKDGGSC